MVITDGRQRFMPSAEDRLPGRGEPLAYPEAVLLVDPVEPEFKGEVLYLWELAALNKVRMYRKLEFIVHLIYCLLGIPKCRWTTNISIHLKTKIIKCMDGFVLTHLWGFGKSLLAMNFVQEGPSNKI